MCVHALSKLQYRFETFGTVNFTIKSVAQSENDICMSYDWWIILTLILNVSYGILQNIFT